MKRLLPHFAVIAALGLATATHAADVGRVLLAAGDTVAIRGNQTVKLAFGTMIQDKDVLRTGSASNLQVRFVDESIVSMKEASELRIDDFRFSGKEDGSERGFLSLLKGGLRTVTGLIGRSNNANYRLSTVTATIGIRGTDYAATLCQGDCRNNDGSPAKDGLYGRTHGISHGTNRIDVSNERDQKSFGINENFYVADAKSIVEPLLVAPDFVSNKLEGRKQGGGKGESGGSGSEQATTGGAAAESRPSTTPEPLPQLQFVATQDLGPQGTPAVLPPANGFVVASPFIGVIFDDDTPGTFNGLNQLTAYGTLGIFPAGSLNGGSIADTGSLALSTGQVITWGRWTGNTLIMSGTGPTVTGTPLLFVTASGVGNDSTGSLGGVATYTYAGGPSPVDAGGNVGSITSTSATINFTLQTAALSLGVNFPGIVASSVNTGPASFSVSGTGSRVIGSGGDFIGGLSGTCTGSGCLGGTGAAGGFFEAGTTGANGYEFAVFGGLLSATNAGAAVFLNTYLNSSFTPGPAPTTVPTIAGLGTFFDAFTVTPDPGDGGGFLFPTNMTTVPAGAASNLATPQILTGFTVPPGFNAEPSGGSIAVSGSTVSGSVIDETVTNSLNAHWGRWTSGTFIDTPSSTTFSPNNQFHYLYGPLTPPEVVAAKTGSFAMSMVAGTTPTNQLGQTGTFSTSLNVNFTAQTATFGPSSFTFPSDSWTFSGGATAIQIAPGKGAFIDTVTTGTCSGSTCLTSTPAVLGKTGIFMGPAGDHLGVAFSARTTSGPTAHAQTAKIFSCAPC